MNTFFNWLTQLEEVLGSRIIQYRYIIIVSCLILVTVAGLGLKQFTLASGYRQLFSETNAKMLALDALEAEFTEIDTVLFVVEPSSGNVFTPETLSAMVEFTERAWNIPYAQRVDSLTNFQHTWADGDDLIVEDLVTEAHALDEEQLQKIRTVALSEPTLKNYLISAKGHVAGIIVVFNIPAVELGGDVPEDVVSRSAQALKMEFEQRYPNLKLHITGSVILENGFYQTGLSDSLTVIPISFALMMLILITLSRSIVATLLTAVVIIFSIVISLGTVAHFGVVFHTGNATAPTIILTIASASCVHLLITYLYQLRTTGKNKEAITESLRVNFQPITITSVSTGIGFLSILLSDIPAFRVLSMLVTLGVLISWFLVIFFLPALLSFFPDKKITTKPNKFDQWFAYMMDQLGQFVAYNGRWLLRGMLLLVALLMLGLPKIYVNDNFIEYFDDTIDLKKASDFAMENMTGITSAHYGLSAGEEGAINEPDFLKEVEQFAQWLEVQKEVLHVNTMTDTYKRLNQNMHGDDSAFYRLPDTREEAAQYLLLYELSLPYGLDLNTRVNLDKSKTRLSVTFGPMSSADYINFDQRADQWLNNNTKYLKGTPALGQNVNFSYLSLKNSKDMLFNTSAALIVISILLIILLRSVRIGLLSMVPNLAPAAIGFGIWGFIHAEINMILSLVMTMTLGIVVDDTVHFLSKYQRAINEKGLNPQQAVTYSFRTVGQALIVTSLMLACGFFSIAQSHFVMNATMGMLTGIIILAALIADFFLLPPLLMKYGGYTNSTSKLAMSPPHTKSLNTEENKAVDNSNKQRH